MRQTLYNTLRFYDFLTCAIVRYPAVERTSAGRTLNDLTKLFVKRRISPRKAVAGQIDIGGLAIKGIIVAAKAIGPDRISKIRKRMRRSGEIRSDVKPKHWVEAEIFSGDVEWVHIPP